MPSPELPNDDEEFPAEPLEIGDDDADAALADRLLRDSAPSERPTLAPEPLFSLLFADAIEAEDRVLRDYARHVIPRLSALLGHVSAKGGNFAREKRAAGLSDDEVARYGDDQSMRAHIVNGLLPAARIARTFVAWGAMRFVDEFDDGTYRLFCAGFTLHDWLKLPDVDVRLRRLGLEHHTVNVAVHLPDVEAILRDWCVELGIDRFLEPLGSLDTYLHDLILIASNTQLKWGVMHNLSALPGLRARRRSTLLATNLATLADYLAYLGRTPIEAATHPSILRELESFSDETVQLTLTYHHLADVRGVITNIIHNAAVAAMHKPGVREPLLYAPSGVVYITRRDAPAPPAVDAVASAAIERIRQLCQRQLSLNLTGFARSGKGMKYADYYNLFFTPRDLVRLVAEFAERRIANKSISQSRYDSIASKRMAPADIDLDLPDGVEVDRLAETCALLVKIAAEAAPDVDAEGWLLEQLDLASLRPLLQSINSNKTAGGVPYGWYYVAGMYRRRQPGRDEQQWVDHLHALSAGLAEQLPDSAVSDVAGWQEMRRYIIDHLRFAETPVGDLQARVQAELGRYSGARKSGRGATTVCALCSSPYSVSVQQEAAILFAPMVYTNKQSLHSSKAIRHICAVCGFEMMLRQLLMKRGRESGGNFEKRRLRYLFFYPTYFFTPETLHMLRAMQDRLRRVSFTGLRNALLPTADSGDSAPQLYPALFQRCQDLMLHPAAIEREEDDRLFRLRFPANEPITFSFVGIPPGERDAKDAEAWINPAFLALVLPLLLDVKVVASESMLPLMQEATELPETVAFDSAHAFVAHLIEPGRREVGHADASRLGRVNLDELLPALQRVTVAYFVHLDGNAKSGGGGFDYRWHDMPALARDLATSPLYAFHYLKKGQRRDAGDGLPLSKAAAYVEMVERYLHDGSPSMSHARNLVILYRQFYRHKPRRLNANSILRPLSEAAETILTADQRLFDDDEALIEAVQGRLAKFIENVDRKAADGAIPRWIDVATRQAKLEEFSRYMVEQIYRDSFGRDRSALAGKQLNLLKNACEAIYLAEQRREWQERGERAETHDEPEAA
jgi:CRISPR-associated protein Csc3